MHMITRDITLQDAVLDLIDNSVDSAWRRAGSPHMDLDDGADLSPFAISIVATPERFAIADNCGGMTLREARDYAFSFGRPGSEAHSEYSIGVYGIGMKRAAFKLGERIFVRSTYRDDSDATRHAFMVPIVVTDWLKDEALPWTFAIVPTELREENGVEVAATTLTSSAKAAFRNPTFLKNLRRMIARDYTLHLGRGLRITINGEAVDGAQLELLQNEQYVPMRVHYTEEVDAETVDVEIIAGMAAPPPEDPDPEDTDDREKRFGWYVACNGRIVLAADKTTVSGWGTSGWPIWHPQYAGFLGLVLFTASNAAALPLTTTKRSVDLSSEIFLRARHRMREVSKEWTAYTNARKQFKDAARRKEAEASPVAIQAVKAQVAASLPRFFKEPRRANVNYSVPLDRMKQLASAFGDIGMPYREVGRKSFEYTYEDLVGDE